jgi:hypothetical protein
MFAIFIFATAWGLAAALTAKAFGSAMVAAGTRTAPRAPKHHLDAAMHTSLPKWVMNRPIEYVGAGSAYVQ